MRALIALTLSCLLIAGCAKKEPETMTPPDSTASGTPAPTGGGNVAPLGPAAGGITPMTGDLEGAGGGGSAAMAAKGMAKSAAAKAGTPAGMGGSGGEDDGG